MSTASRKPKGWTVKDPRKGWTHYKQRKTEITPETICAKCQIKPAQEVHHIHQIAAGGDPFDPRNRVPLCKACHRAEHKRPTFYLERN